MGVVLPLGIDPIGVIVGLLAVVAWRVLRRVRHR
jgi:hypothetical protein